MSEHVELKVVAKRKDTEIWLGDDEGHFVAKGVGTLEEMLLPGDYVVSFTLQGKKIPIKLKRKLLVLEDFECE